MLFLQVSFTISIIMIPNLKGKRALLNILIQYFIETLSRHELVVTKDEGKGRHNNRSSKKKKKTRIYHQIQTQLPKYHCYRVGAQPGYFKGGITLYQTGGYSTDCHVDLSPVSKRSYSRSSRDRRVCDSSNVSYLHKLYTGYFGFSVKLQKKILFCW